MHAAAPATVAQRLPLASVERVRGFSQNGVGAVHDKASLALLSQLDQAGIVGAKSMKSLNIAIAMGALALLSCAGCSAAVRHRQRRSFIDAVQKRDGDKATSCSRPIRRSSTRKDANGDTGLIIALRGVRSGLAGFLLNKGADPNLSGANGDTPLIAAAKVGFERPRMADRAGRQSGRDKQVGRNRR